MRVTTYTATLELKTEKTNAHSRGIQSVAYSPNGSQMVSADAGGTIKVWEWDSGVFSLSPRRTQQNLTTLPSLAATLELKTERQNAHDSRINSVAYSPDGSQMVSASGDMFTAGRGGTIKVWEWEAGSRPNSNAAHFLP